MSQHKSTWCSASRTSNCCKSGYEVGDKSLDRAGGVVAAIGMVLEAA
jgi:hypothetical protein